MILLENAINTLAENLKSVDYGEAFTTARGNIYRTRGLPNTARLRMDWEFASDFLDELSEESPEWSDKDKVIDLMMMQASVDLEDLIVNGDTENHNDALLKSMDGSIKRGSVPEYIEIISGVLIEDPKDDITGFVLFITLYVRWK